MKKLLLVGPVILMVIALHLLHAIGIVSDSGVERVFSRFDDF